MLNCPKAIKILLIVLAALSVIASIIFFFFPDLLKPRKSIISEKMFREIDSKVEAVSQIPNIKIKEDDSEKFVESVNEWEVFGEGKFFLNSIEDFISPNKIIFYLTDQQQLYNWVYLGDSSDVILSLGEGWDENNKNLDLYVYIDPLILKNNSIKNANKMLNSYILNVLYERTHREELEYYRSSQGHIFDLLSEGRLPFNLEKNE